MKFSTSLFALLLTASIGFAQAAVSIDVTCKDFAGIETKLKLESPDNLFIESANTESYRNVGIPVADFNPGAISKQFKVKDLPTGMIGSVSVAAGGKFSNSEQVADYALHIFIANASDPSQFSLIIVDNVLDVVDGDDSQAVMSWLILRSNNPSWNVAKGVILDDKPGKISNKVLCQFK